MVHKIVSGPMACLLLVILFFAGCSGSNNAVPAIPGYTNPTTTGISMDDTSATLVGSFSNPAGYITTVWSEYGKSTSYGRGTSHWSYGAPNQQE